MGLISTYWEAAVFEWKHEGDTANIKEKSLRDFLSTSYSNDMGKGQNCHFAWGTHVK